jgi:membrane protease YdiL (CAAX protease family)
VTEAPLALSVAPSSGPRGRLLIACLAVSVLASVVCLEFVWPTLLGQRPPLIWNDFLFALVHYASLGTLLMYPLSRHGDDFLRLFTASRPDHAAIRWAVTTGVASAGVSLVSMFAVFIPLSYLSPGFVQEWLIDPATPIIWTSGDSYMWANIANFLLVALLAPVVEETFFRGLLLPAWSRRFGPMRAMIWSSLFFAVLHPDIVGSFIGGVVLALVFLKTRTLWLPIVMHVTHNTLAWTYEAGELVFFGESQYTLADFQATWWIGLAGFLVGVPLLVRALRRMPVPLAS